MNRILLIVLFVIAFVLNGVAEEKNDLTKLKPGVTENKFEKELSDNVKRIGDRVGTLNTNLKKNGNGVMVISALLLVIGVILVYLIYIIKKLQDRISQSNHQLHRKMDSIRNSSVSESRIQDMLVQLKRSLSDVRPPNISRGANLEPTPPTPNPNPAFYNNPSEIKPQPVEPSVSSKRIAVAYDTEKNIFTKSNNSKLYYLLTKSRLAELWLEERMGEINDISFQNEFSQFFEISQTSEKSKSSGYHVIKPAKVVWDSAKEIGSLKFLGQINRNSG